MADLNSQYYAILTNVGAAKQANADALGIAWRITQLGIGDGNGAEPTPNATQLALINEWRRAPLNQLKVDDKDPSIIVAEQVIPADIGGRWIREIGLYDADGDLVAVANCPPTYKPLLSQGSGRTQVVRMSLVVSSASNVQLKIDPSVVLATREWVEGKLAEQDTKPSVLVATTANIALSGLQSVDGVALTAGARVLVKNQNAGKDNGIYVVVAGGAWTRSADADVSAEVTPGLMVSVEKGTTNGDSVWQLVTDAPITLGVTPLVFEMLAGPSGVTVGTYNRITVDRYGRVIAGSNPTTLSGHGINDAYTKPEIESMIAQASALPVGTMVAFPAATVPPGFLEADGSLQSATAYPDLAAYLGTKYNTGGEPAGYFRLPDSRGEFLRGWDHGRGVDAGRSLGSVQKGSYLQMEKAASTTVDRFTSSISYGISDDKLAKARLNWDSTAPGDYGGAQTYGVNEVTVSTTSSGAGVQATPYSTAPADSSTNESLFVVGAARPRNIAVMWCIKAWNAPINQGNIDIAALAALAAQATDTKAGLARFGTDAEQIAGLLKTVMSNPAGVLALLSVWFPKRIFATNDYIRIPDVPGGLILQWGEASSGAASHTVNWPIRFPNKVLMAIAYDQTNSTPVFAIATDMTALTDVSCRFVSSGTFGAYAFLSIGN
ncbi:phage tail protein [Pseudomonas shirazensis]|uniref:Phage tail protein n=1 Tax=Pseudomonas shirazensis TaxID=2745494 RepID=A0ABU8ZYC1_9PSED